MAEETKVPSEMIMSAKWDKLLERVVINAGTGCVIGVCASFVLTRGFAYRLAMSTFGAGTGVGIAVEKSSAEFKER